MQQDFTVGSVLSAGEIGQRQVRAVVGSPIIDDPHRLLPKQAGLPVDFAHDKGIARAITRRIVLRYVA